MDTKRLYQFSWDLLGDIQLGRPNLGLFTRLEIYRLMQFCFRDVLEQHVGTEETNQIFYEAGKLAGSQFYANYLGSIHDFSEFVQQLQSLLKEMGIGILRFEHTDLENNSFVLTIAEDIDCSGLPELGYEVCTFDEGFICGVMENFSGKSYVVKEIDCWCTGDRTCRFTAEAVE